MNHLLAGTTAGFLATAPMTAAMELMHRRLPSRERYPLPPREITMELAAEAGVEKHLDEPQRLGATLAAHFAYGAACGTLYSVLARNEAIPGSPVAKGIGFGLAVWTVSYLGLLPAAGILKPATEHPPRRNTLMIAAHVVWGACTGLLTGALADSPRHNNSTHTGA